MVNRTRSRNNRQHTQPKPLGGMPVFLLTLTIGLFIRFALTYLHVAVTFTFILWFALLLGAVSKKYPIPARSNSEPSERQLRSYRTWTTIKNGLIPTGGALRADWLAVHRVAWWMGWTLGLLAGYNGSTVYTLVGLPFMFMATMGVMRWRDRAADARHPYTGVSIPASIRHHTGIRRVLLFVPAMLVMAVCAWLTAVGTLQWNMSVGLTLLSFLLTIWISSRSQQSQRWKRTVDMQTMLDQWFATDALKKAYPSVYVTQVDVINPNDNPLTVIRFRIQDADGNGYGNTMAYKLGDAALKPIAQPAGYGFATLLGAKAKGKGFTFDPNAVRLVLAKDASAIPDASRTGMDDKLATLVADIAYAQAAIPWKKRPPLTKAHQVSADPERNAWLLELHQPPEGYNNLERIGIDWLPNPDSSPARWMRLPMFADLANKFHLAAEPDTPLSDDGNKWRTPGIVTGKPSFNDYITMSRQYNTDLNALSDLFKGTKLTVPMFRYDGARTMDEQGWPITVTPLVNTGTTTASDYARFDWTTLDPSARYLGVMDDRGTTMLVKAAGRIPDRIDKISASGQGARAYAQSLIFTTLVSQLPSKAGVHIDSLSQEGKDCAIWRVRFHLDGGGTMADIRKRIAQIKAAVGARNAYLDWDTSDSGILWLTGDPMLDINDIDHWKRRAAQKDLIQLALSDAWGVAGVYDSEGRNPTVTKLGTLPHNHQVLLARFEVPGGISVDKPKDNMAKYLTEADYMYGRILPRGDEHGARCFDMVLAKHSPFPMTVKADWELVRRSDRRIFPFGVDDMGETVEWKLKSTPHLVIEGKSGTGKSSAMQIAVAEAFMRGGKVILIDPSKGCVDFTQWAKPRALAFVGEGQMRETEAALGWAAHEMSIRVAINTKYGVGNMYDLDPDSVDPEDREHLYPLFVCFDEFNSYLQKAGKMTSNPNHDVKLANENAQISATNTSIARAMSMISAIATQGRTAGVHLIIGAQRLGMKDLEPYNGGAFFRSTGRILLGADTTMGVITQPNVSEANRLQKQLKGQGGKIPSGRGLYESMDGVLSAVQTWFYSGDQQDFLDLVSDIPQTDPVDLTSFLPKEADSFGEMSKDSIQEEIDKAKKNEAADAAALEELFGMGDDDDEDGMETLHI